MRNCAKQISRMVPRSETLKDGMFLKIFGPGGMRVAIEFAGPLAKGVSGLVYVFGHWLLSIVKRVFFREWLCSRGTARSTPAVEPLPDRSSTLP